MWPLIAIAQFRQFQEDAKDASVLECTWTFNALEALRNALYKFMTYLLTCSKRYCSLSHPMPILSSMLLAGMPADNTAGMAH